jgi:hypothetical protein
VVEEPLKARQVGKARDLPLGNDGQRLDMLGQIISWWLKDYQSERGIDALPGRTNRVL